ncbi:MAG: hypothetical protein FJ290_28985 [Planctomycetes bacterium]|nr:hypothetical protein [Planctomycetota bacterium]
MSDWVSFETATKTLISIGSMAGRPTSEMHIHQLMAHGFSRQGAGDLLAGGIITQGNDQARAAATMAKMRPMPGTGGMNMSFNLQFLQLQQQMQSESRHLALISNIVKLKRDTAKSVINNIR